MPTQPGGSDTRTPLLVAGDWWKSGAETGEEAVLEVERSDADEVKLEIREPGEAPASLYLSRAAAKEIGEQLLARAREEWNVA